MKKTLLISLILLVGLSIEAQQVSTMYFLENAPMRHTVNPAMQPVGNGYINLTPIGYTSLWAGNNSLTMHDLIYNNNGNTITALHPDADRQQLLNLIKNTTITDESLTIGIFNLGVRHKTRGYIYIGINERIDLGTGLPKSFYTFALDGGMKDLTGGVNTIDLGSTALSLNAYTEVSGGYSYKLNDKWTVGGKLKFLMGQAFSSLSFKNLTIDASTSQWHLTGQGSLVASAPVNWSALPKQLNYETIKTIDTKQLTQGIGLMEYITPKGYGAAVDLGFTYRPISQVQISASINDLGFIYWNGANYAVSADTTFTGVQNLQYSTYANKGNNYKFDTNKLWQDIQAELQGLGKCLNANSYGDTYTRMLNARLNVGVDANFVHNILGIGVVGNLRYYYNQLAAEVTVGGAIRPCKWFNMAVSYSLINNGRFSNIGAGISLMPYDGINLTLAMDYIPTQYADYNGMPIPYDSKGMNLALGLSIIWGTNNEPKEIDKNAYIPTEAKQTVRIKKSKIIDKNKVYTKEDARLASVMGDSIRTTLTPQVYELLSKALYDITFPDSKAILTNKGEHTLDQIAQQLIDHPNYHVQLFVYTDNVKSVNSSLELSQERADAILSYLVNAGVPDEQIEARGMGQANPVATNSVKEGRARNNRVMFYIQ